jgi:predicted enzyme related to lactoylglutathione lyase
MPHKSRQRIVVIDCKTSDLASAGRFWAGALGGEVDVGPDGKYATIKPTTDHMVILQAGVDHEPRVHIDIETDNQPAEVARLEALGAKVVAPIKTRVVMEAPTGHRFCVVNPQSADFAERATTWP